MNMEKIWYTCKEIIKMFGITSQTLYNWKKKGIVDYRKITRKTILYKIKEQENV